MRPLLGCILICLLAVALDADGALADDAGLSAKHHAWGRFQPGAWKLVRVVTETFDDHGAVTGTNLTETKTTLQQSEDDGITLEVEVGMEVAGKQFDAQPQRIKQGFHGELLNPNLKIRPPRSGQVTIESREIPCRVQQLELSAGNNKTLVTVYFSDTMAPYILKRESVTTDADGKNVLGEATLEVVAVDMPWKVLGEVKNVACVKSVQKHAGGAVTTLAMTSSEVPGGIVYQTSKETDKSGQLTRRSVLELVNYGLRPEEERSGVFGRKRPARVRKSAAHAAPW